jgi:hypothetical protein
MSSFKLSEAEMRQFGRRVFDISFSQDETIYERLAALDGDEKDGQFDTLAEATEALLLRQREGAYRAFGREYRSRPFPELRRILTPQSILRKRVIKAGASHDEAIAACAGLADSQVEDLIRARGLGIKIERLPADADIRFAGEMLPIGSKVGFLRTSIYGPPDLTIGIVSRHRAVFPWSGGAPTVDHECVNPAGRSVDTVCSRQVAAARPKGFLAESYQKTLYLDVEAAKAGAIESCRGQIRGIEAMMEAFRGQDVPHPREMQKIVTAAQMPPTENIGP